MKQIIQIILSFALLFSLTGCAPKTNQKASESTDAPSSSTSHAVYEMFSLAFIDTDQKRIVKEEQELRIAENVPRERLILDALKMGPKSNQLTSPIAESAVIHSIKTVSGLCTIDMSAEFLNTTDKNNETANLMLHAIVQSLCELDTIQQVKLNIDGNTTAKINDNIDLSQPISPDPANI